jgi:hypothetical protein
MMVLSLNVFGHGLMYRHTLLWMHSMRKVSKNFAFVWILDHQVLSTAGDVGV